MTQEPSRSGQDPIGDFQRWIFRSGARSVSREVSDQIRSALGVGGGPADVWAKATTPPADEAPECAWCPVCRAARVLRESGPGVSSQMSAAGEAMGVLARDAMSVFESALAATSRAARAGAGQGQAPSSSVWADVTAADPGRGGPGRGGPGRGGPGRGGPGRGGPGRGGPGRGGPGRGGPGRSGPGCGGPGRGRLGRGGPRAGAGPGRSARIGGTRGRAAP